MPMVQGPSALFREKPFASSFDTINERPDYRFNQSKAMRKMIPDNGH
jgi:hypothetical protein